MSAFLTPDPKIEAAIRTKGEKLFALMDQQPPPALFSKKGAYARLMEWSMKDPVFKTQLFRFVDVLPSLNSSAEIVRHLQEYLGVKAVELNPAMKAGLAASAFAPGRTSQYKFPSRMNLSFFHVLPSNTPLSNNTMLLLKLKL